MKCQSLSFLYDQSRIFTFESNFVPFLKTKVKISISYAWIHLKLCIHCTTILIHRNIVPLRSPMKNFPDWSQISWGVLKLLTSIPRVFCHFSEFFIHTFSYSCNKIQCCRVKARSWTWFWYVFYNAGFIFTLIPAPEKKKWGQNLKDGTLRFGRIFARKCLSWF